MGLNLRKGQGLNLVKEDGTTLKHIGIGLGWQENKFDTGADFDPDVSLFVCTDKEKGGWPQVYGQDWIICYAQPKSPNDIIVHGGDDRVGGDGNSDNELIKVDLTRLPAEVTNLNVVISIYEAAQRKQNFGMMNKAYVRILDLDDSGKEIMRFELNEGDTALATAVIAAKVYKDSKGNWTFKAMQDGFENGLGDFVRNYGGIVDSE